MNLTLRLLMAGSSLIPLMIIWEALAVGWISLPFGRPLTRRLRPWSYWSLVGVAFVVASGLIVTALVL